jgi:hypothetical protein
MSQMLVQKSTRLCTHSYSPLRYVIADTDKHSEDKVERFEEGRTCAAPGSRNNPEWSIVKARH